MPASLKPKRIVEIIGGEWIHASATVPFDVVEE